MKMFCSAKKSTQSHQWFTSNESFECHVLTFRKKSIKSINISNFSMHVEKMYRLLDLWFPLCNMKKWFLEVIKRLKHNSLHNIGFTDLVAYRTVLTLSPPGVTPLRFPSLNKTIFSLRDNHSGTKKYIDLNFWGHLLKMQKIVNSCSSGTVYFTA